MTSGMNFQPYALETFNNAMGMIEAVTLLLVTSGEKIENDEEADPIVCATDILDGLVEGLGGNFAALVSRARCQRIAWPVIRDHPPRGTARRVPSAQSHGPR